MVVVTVVVGVMCSGSCDCGGGVMMVVVTVVVG